jgi:hypothetical protein
VWAGSAGAPRPRMSSSTTCTVQLSLVVTTAIWVAAIAGGIYTDQSVQSGTIYYYVVTAVNPQGQESPYSNETRVTIP